METQQGKQSGWRVRCAGEKTFGVVLLNGLLLLLAGRLFAQPELSVTFAWDPSVDPSAVGYRIFYGPASGDYANSVDVGGDTSGTVSDLVQGVTYYFAVAAYNVAHVTGGYSTEISYTIPVDSNTPAISAISNQTTPANTSTPAIPFTVTDLATDASNLVLSATSDNPGLVAAPNIVFAGSGSTRTVTITPSAGQSGVADITVTVSFGNASASTTFQLTVNAVIAGKPSNPPPVSPPGNIPVPVPFVLTPGTYSGLFYDTNQVEASSSGTFTLIVTKRATYSGYFQIGGHRFLFDGKLDGQGHAANLLARRAAAALRLSLDLGAGAQANQVFGSLSGGAWVASLIGDRSVYNARKNAAPNAGAYTIVFPGQESSPLLPAGDGYGTVRVTPGGLVRFAGKLADGLKVSQSATLSSDGQWPFYLSLYGGQGLLTGWLDFTNEVASDLSGLLTWTRPAERAAQYYPSGFTIQIQAAGSIYTPPVGPVGRILGLTNATVAFVGGDIAAAFTNFVSLAASDRVADLSANSLSLAFWPASGLFTGLVYDMATGQLLPFGGAVFQKLATGYGMSMGADQSSEVFIGP